MKLPRPKNPYTRELLLHVKVNPDEKKLIERKARQYTDSNISEWLRLAGVLFEPKKEKSK